MKIFISGGSKSGKSMLAQRLAQKLRAPGKPLYYLATMIPTDNEDRERIKRHKQDREGLGYETVEAGRGVYAAVANCEKDGFFLLDSVTALLANEMFLPGGEVVPGAYRKVADDLEGIICHVGGIVVVSDNVFSDAYIYDELTESYRRGLAYIDRQAARLCDTVLEVCGGLCIALKGGGLLDACGGPLFDHLSGGLLDGFI